MEMKTVTLGARLLINHRLPGIGNQTGGGVEGVSWVAASPAHKWD